jgi:UDP-2,3-diacylglucosamine pyrophosphatase LpxH
MQPDRFAVISDLHLGDHRPEEYALLPNRAHMQPDRFAVISDLHLGDHRPEEYALLPNRWILERLCQFLADRAVRTLVVNGDAFALYADLRSCIRDGEVVFGALREVVHEVLLVPGNHDLHLQTLRDDPLLSGETSEMPMLRDLGITLCPETLTIGRASLFHGHLPDSAFAAGKSLNGKFREHFAAVAASTYATRQYGFSEHVEQACLRALGFSRSRSRRYPSQRERLQSLTDQCAMDAIPEGNVVLVGHTHIAHAAIPYGGRAFWNSGCWVLNAKRLSQAARGERPWPGGVALVRCTGEVTLTNLLGDIQPDRMLDLAINSPVAR